MAFVDCLETIMTRRAGIRIAGATVGAAALVAVVFVVIYNLVQPPSARSEVAGYLMAAGLDDSVEVEACVLSPASRPSSVPDWYFDCTIIVSATASLRPREQLSVGSITYCFAIPRSEPAIFGRSDSPPLPHGKGRCF